MWEVEVTDEFLAWYQDELADDQIGAIDARVDLLEAGGPNLGRPVVDRVEESRHHNMKELRCSKDGALRVLFIFDPLRHAILLLGGDKSEDQAWNEWYTENVPRADDLYDEHIRELKDEGLLP